MRRERQPTRQHFRRDVRMEPDPERRMRRQLPSPGSKEQMQLHPSRFAPTGFLIPRLPSIFWEPRLPEEFLISGRWSGAVRFWSGIASFQLQTRPDPGDDFPDFRAACARANCAAPLALGGARVSVATASALSFR